MSETQLIYLGTNDGLRILRRETSESSWEQVGQALDNAPLTALVPVPDGSGNILCAVGVWGLWRCTPDGKKVTGQNAGIANREIHALAVSANGSTMMAGSAPPEIYCSEDAGEEWWTMESFLEHPSAERWDYPVPPHYANIRQIVAHPTENETFYVAIEVGGLYRTRDAGGTWQEITGDMDPDCHAIALHPERPERILVSTPRGPYLSQNEGKSWTQLWQDRTPTYSASIAVCPSEPDRVIAGISRGFRGGEAAIWTSQDGGETWNPAEGNFNSLAPSQIRGALVYSRSQPQTAYAGTLAGDLFESRDAGQTWKPSHSGLPPIRSIYAP